MRHAYCFLVLLVACGALSAEAFVSKIRAGETKIPCHQVFDLYRGAVVNALSDAQALARLELLCGCTMAGQDLTDLTNFKAVLDGIPKLELGSTADANTAETQLQIHWRLKKVDEAEAACRLFELGDDAVLSEQELRNFIGIP